MKPIYLDHAASTPVHPEVAAVMYHMLLNEYGNASSVHQFGRSAKRIINGARDRIAGFWAVPLRSGCSQAAARRVIISPCSAQPMLLLPRVDISLLQRLSIMQCCIPARSLRGRASRSPIFLSMLPAVSLWRM